MLPIAQQVMEIIQEVSRKLVLPRFRQLKESEIKEKSPGNFVTIVDLEAEAFLKKKLITFQMVCMFEIKSQFCGDKKLEKNQIS